MLDCYRKFPALMLPIITATDVVPMNNTGGYLDDIRSLSEGRSDSLFLLCQSIFLTPEFYVSVFSLLKHITIDGFARVVRLKDI